LALLRSGSSGEGKHAELQQQLVDATEQLQEQKKKAELGEK
jgi:hypothetical protein